MEKKTKHTPAPWSIGVVPDYNDTLKSAMLEVQSNSYWICKVQNNGMIGSDEGKANALLIAAAPDMLSAFIKIVRFKKYDRDEDYVSITEIESLIKKATGDE